jgi:hypothetical protein
MGSRLSKAPQERKLAHQRAFLSAFEGSGCIRHAAKHAQITRETHYKWLKHDPVYRAAFKESRRAAGDHLESIAVERATVGWLEPIHYQGKVCGHVRRYDGGLLQFLLRGMMPEKYGVKRHEVSAPKGTPTQPKIEVVFVNPNHSDQEISGLPDQKTENGRGGSSLRIQVFWRKSIRCL